MTNVISMPKYVLIGFSEPSLYKFLKYLWSNFLEFDHWGLYLSQFCTFWYKMMENVMFKYPNQYFSDFLKFLAIVAQCLVGLVWYLGPLHSLHNSSKLPKYGYDFKIWLFFHIVEKQETEKGNIF